MSSSSWGPLSANWDAFEADTWSYSAAEKQAIIAALDMRDESEADSAMYRITMEARAFRGLLANERRRPKHIKREVAQQLEALEYHASALLQVLSELHPATDCEMARAMLPEIRQAVRQLPPVSFAEILDMKATPTPKSPDEELREMLTHLVDKVRKTRQSYEPRGRNPSFACYSFARSLFCIWQQYAKPGSGHVINPLTEEHEGRFLEFGRACCKPIPHSGNLDSYLIAAYKNRL